MSILYKSTNIVNEGDHCQQHILVCVKYVGPLEKLKKRLQLSIARQTCRSTYLQIVKVHI